MRAEIPVFKRCCFCMPLRRGLMLWAYFRLILIVALLILDAVTCSYVMGDAFILYYGLEWFQELFVTLIGIMAFIITIFLIISAHKKNSKHLRATYIWESVSVILLCSCFATTVLFDFIRYGPLLFRYWRIFLWAILSQLIYIGIQLYVIALIRSEVLKLESQHEFRFVNQVAEAECQYYGQGAPPSPRTARPPNAHTVQEQDEEIV